ncbi:MAG: 4'-phosphopantetheinyl transferase superfamily protein [Bacteroidetes bacterium]|nr:4'-phosphopantetheinyl transferase superfamily protein [Bacteroidota bacterium]
MEIYNIHIVEHTAFEKERAALLSRLPFEQQQRISRFRKPLDMQRSLLGETMCRVVLGQHLKKAPVSIEILKSEKGKPYLKNQPNLHFNLSHSGEWVVLAVDETEVGIDIEKIRKIDYNIAQRFFSNEEYSRLEALKGDDKRRYFFTLWTLKESYLKFLGKGLTKALSSFTVIENGKDYRIKHAEQMDETIFFNTYEPDASHLVSICSGKKDVPGKVHILKIHNLINNPSI